MNAVDWLLEIPKRYAEREFLIDTLGNQSLTFEALHRSALSVAADLRRRGLHPGDRVVIVLHNSGEFAKLYLACLYARLVTVPINPVFSQAELNYIIRSSRCRLVIVSNETAEQVERVAEGPERLVLQDGRSGQAEWNLSELPEAPDFVPLAGATPQDTMTIVFTSGTTSSPTGVVHRIADLVDNARLFNERLGITPENRFYGILAMTYLGGYYNLLMLPYVAGASVVLANVFDARSALEFWGPARAHGVNTLWVVPTIMAILMELDRGHEGADYCREKVRLGLVGTAPLAPALRQAFEQKYGVALYENYGLSETLFITTNSPATPVLDGSVGLPLPGVQVTIVDSRGLGVSHGTEGEVAVCTPYLMEGVLQPETGETLASAANSWHLCGDLGVLAPTGELFITGRKKDLIIRGGVNISPAAIENVIQSHAAVLECAVVGVPHGMYGEEVGVVLRLEKGHRLEDVRPELIALCRQSLGSVRQPAHLIEIDEFPRSSTGKIRKADLRGLLADRLGLSLDKAPPVRGQATKQNARVRRAFPRPSPQHVKALGQFSTCLISDCLNRFGASDGTLQRLSPGASFCGPALTVEESEGGNLMSHLALELAEPGDVLVIDAKGCRTRSCWGGLQTLMARRRGLAGAVINGAVRDLEEIVATGFPVYALGLSPAGPLKSWAGNVNGPLACAGLAIHPGDLVVGDADGIVVVPPNQVEEIVELCLSRQRLEQTWRRRVEAGDSTLEAVGLRPRLGELGVEFL